MAKIIEFISEYLPLVPLVAGFFIAYIGIRNRSFMHDFFVDASYYLILASFLIWLWVILSAFQNHRKKIFEIIRENVSGLLCCLLLTISLFIACPPSLKILADEANILSVAKAMTFEKKSDNVTEGLWYYSNFHPTNRVIDKRPLLFPFFVSGLHTLTGYRAANGFMMNFILLTIFFMLIYLAMRYLLGPPWGFVAVLMVASQPLIAQTATASGLEILQAVFFLALIGALVWYLRSSSAESFLFLWVQLLLFINTRYESIAPAVLTILALTLLKKIRQEFIIKYLLVYAASPLLLLPVFCQRVLQFNDREIPSQSVLSAFSPQNFLTNHSIFLKSLFRFDFSLPYATLVNLFALIVFITYAVLFIMKRFIADKTSRQCVWIGMANLGILWLTFTAYFQGRMDHPSMSRFYVIFVAFASLVAVYGLSRLPTLSTKPVIALLVASSCYLIYVPVAMENRFSNAQEVVREYSFLYDFLKKEPDRNFLVLCPRPGCFTIHNYGAMSLSLANHEIQTIQSQLTNRLFNRVFVLQRISYKTRSPVKDDALSDRLVLQTLSELQNTGESFLRISLVTEIKPEIRP